MPKSSELDKSYKRFIIDSIDHDGTAQEKINYLRETFEAEYGWAVSRYGQQGAIREWLQGLPSAVYLPFYNGDIISLAKQHGSLPNNPTESQEEKILENYWNFMAAKVCQLLNGYRVPKEAA